MLYVVMLYVVYVVMLHVVIVMRLVALCCDGNASSGFML